jgi:hypothetical protein
MFAWSDCVFVLGILALVVLAGYLKLVPGESVVAVVAAAVAYFAARTAKLRKDAKLGGSSTDDGRVRHELEQHENSGVVHISPNGTIETSGKVLISKNGHIEIRPEALEQGCDDTPPDSRQLPEKKDDES